MVTEPSRVGALAVLPVKLASRLPDIVDGLTAMVLRETKTFHGDEVIERGLRGSIEANVSILTHLVQNPGDLSRIEAPTEAIDWALRLAQRGIPFSAVLRSYNLCTARFFEICLEELAGSNLNPASAIRDVGYLSTFLHSYADHVCEQISKSYDTERLRWIRQQDVARADLVRAVLDGRTGDQAETQRALDYPLNGRHLAVIVRQSGVGRDDNRLLRLQSLISALSEALGCTKAPLLVPQDNSSVWAWLPLPKSCERVTTSTVQQLTASEPTVHIALSEVKDGITGFIRAHQQSLIAQSVARNIHDHRGRIVAYTDVASLSFLCEDLNRTQEWVGDVLGDLAQDQEQNTRLRESLEAFLNSGASYTTAAKSLNCHKNTVQYRVNRAEAIRGKSYKENRLDLELALLACRWLGSTVCTPSPPTPKRSRPVQPTTVPPFNAKRSTQQD